MLEISNSNTDIQLIEQRVHSLKTIHAPRSGKILAYWLLGILLFLFMCMFLPWQQNIEGTGEITALTPQDRPQEVQTAIPGRIREWRVREGQFVNKNDTLIVLSEIKDDYFDPEFLTRLQEQLSAKQTGITATQSKIGALDKQISALQSGLSFKLNQARNKYLQAHYKLTSDSAEYQAEKANLVYYQRQVASYDSLYNAKPVPLISQTEWEKRRQVLYESQAKVIAKQNKYEGTRNELLNARIELDAVEAEYNDKIAKSFSERSSSEGYLADATGEFSKLRNKYANMVIRNNQYYVIAPQAGYIVKALKSGIGETVKDGSALCTIQPSNPTMAAELYINAMDVPLIAKGRKVRLEFDGWPALQVTGWPSVAVGTFGGIVQVIDYVDSKEGKYRILVTPDEAEPWPKQLRMGSGVYGWIMLNDVPVWYETWRQLNGFPPSLYESPDKDKEGEGDEKEKEKKSGKKIKLKVKK
jgi:multidrug resistance efflux pump